MNNKPEEEKDAKEAIIDRKKEGYDDFQDIPTEVKEEIDEEREEYEKD
jgi:hypothetical protein